LKQAVALYRAAASQGSAEAAEALGSMYDHGWGVDMDYVEAARWFQKAAEKGAPHALFRLAMMHVTGQGVEQDRILAARYLREAAERGETDAQTILGALYWKEDRAARGDILGPLTATELQILPEDREAFSWMRKAAESGESAAQNALGTMYFNGDGVVMDPPSAWAWYSLAAGQGDADAAASAQTIEVHLAPELLSAAKARLDTLRKGLKPRESAPARYR
jgi:TPR repeat protein